jgi:hypothetical protein
MQMKIAIRLHNSRPRDSSLTRIPTIAKARTTTAVAWIAMVNAMSDKPQSQLGWSNIPIARTPQKMGVKTQTCVSLISLPCGSPSRAPEV